MAKSSRLQQHSVAAAKTTKPGHKSIRGVAENQYNEVKVSASFCLTPTCKYICEELSAALNISKSALIEELVRAKYQELLALSHTVIDD